MKNLKEMVITDKTELDKDRTSLYTSVVLLTIIWLGCIEKESGDGV